MIDEDVDMSPPVLTTPIIPQQMVSIIEHGSSTMHAIDEEASRVCLAWLVDEPCTTASLSQVADVDIDMESPNTASKGKERATHISWSSAGLIHHTYLDTLNIVINEELHFLVCHACQEAIVNIRQHLSTKHADANFRLDEPELLTTIMQDLKVVATLPVNIQGPRSPLKGLLIEDALSCDACSSLYTTREAMRKHHSAEHQTIPTPKTWRACKAQRLCKGGIGTHRILWEVDIPERPEMEDPQEKLVEQFMKEIERDLTPVTTETLDARAISPWLLATHWHERIIPRTTRDEVKAWQSQIALPTKDDAWLCGLREAMHNYFEEALELVNRTDDLVLQRLNSPDPSK